MSYHFTRRRLIPYCHTHIVYFAVAHFHLDVWEPGLLVGMPLHPAIKDITGRGHIPENLLHVRVLEPAWVSGVSYKYLLYIIWTIRDRNSNQTRPQTMLKAQVNRESLLWLCLIIVPYQNCSTRGRRVVTRSQMLRAWFTCLFLLKQVFSNNNSIQW